MEKDKNPTVWFMPDCSAECPEVVSSAWGLTKETESEVHTDVEASFQGKRSRIGSNYLSRLPPLHAHLTPVTCDACTDRLTDTTRC